MDKKVLDISVTECRARRPISGHSNRGNRSLRSRDNLRRNSLFTAGDLTTGRKDSQTNTQVRPTAGESRRDIWDLKPAGSLLPPSISLRRVGWGVNWAERLISSAHMFSWWIPLKRRDKFYSSKLDSECACECARTSISPVSFSTRVVRVF